MKVCRETIIAKWMLRPLWVTAALVAGWTFAVAQSKPEAGAITSSAAAGAIVGRVLNADGSPAIAVDVAAVPDSTGVPAEKLIVGNTQMIAVTAPTSQVAALTRTDGSGRFKLESLPAGRYRVAAGVVLKHQCPPGASCAGGPSFAPFLFRPTYFPIASAQPLTVNAAAPMNVQFSLTAFRSAGFRVSGQFVGAIPPSVAPSQLPPRVKLDAECVPSSNEQRSAIFGNPEKFITGGVAADGAFELRDVPAGTYALCFSVGTPYYLDVTKVTVDKNLSGLSLTIPGGATGGRGN